MESPEIDVQVSYAPIGVKQRGITLGLPRNSTQEDRRFPLTPEAVRTLTEDFEFKVFVESDAGKEIHYSDSSYLRNGAIICDRAATLGADIVISAAELSVNDIKLMRKNATVWTIIPPHRLARPLVESVNQKAVTMLSLTALITSEGHRPVWDILSEIDGRAAIAVAAGLLADGVHGKGILLGGVTGIVPCEVVVIGCGTPGIAAARSACGLGATVRIFDNDVCRLRQAQIALGSGIIGSSIHRNVYLKALQSADVIINTLVGEECIAARINSDEVTILKRGVILFDFNGNEGTVFPSVKHIDLSPAADRYPDLTERICFVNPGNAVPRTSAMALSNVLVPLLSSLAMSADRTFMDAARMNTFLRSGIVTFGGKLVNHETAVTTGLKWFDPDLFLHMS